MRGWNGWSDVVLFFAFIGVMFLLRLGWAVWVFDDPKCALAHCVKVKP